MSVLWVPVKRELTVHQSQVPVRHHGIHDPRAGSWSRLLCSRQIDFNFLGHPTQSVVLLITMRLSRPAVHVAESMR